MTKQRFTVLIDSKREISPDHVAYVIGAHMVPKPKWVQAIKVSNPR